MTDTRTESNRAADVALALALGETAAKHDAAAIQARADRRKVWERLKSGGMKYEEMADTFGVGVTTLTTEIRRAREGSE